MNQDDVLYRCCECLAAQMEFNRVLVERIKEMNVIIKKLVEFAELSSDAQAMVMASVSSMDS